MAENALFTAHMWLTIHFAMTSTHTAFKKGSGADRFLYYYYGSYHNHVITF
jgi:hypothetical protein